MPAIPVTHAELARGELRPEVVAALMRGLVDSRQWLIGALLAELGEEDAQRLDAACREWVAAGGTGKVPEQGVVRLDASRAALLANTLGYVAALLHGLFAPPEPDKPQQH